MVTDKKLNGYFGLALLLQFAILATCIALHRLFINQGGLVGEAELVEDSMTNPTLGRLVYVIIATMAFAILTALAIKRSKSSEVLIPFVLGTFAGTFLWQCVGEDLWHFSVGGTHFVCLEDVSVLPFTALFLLLLLYHCKSKCFDWGALCMLLSFGVNWFGHLDLEGVYPIFSGLCSQETWYLGVGLVLGLSLLLVSLYLGLVKTNTPKAKVLSAILCYHSIALIAFGVIGI